MVKKIFLSAFAAGMLTLGADARAGGAVDKPLTGVASYYSDRFHGRKTASGKPYNKDDLTAAHKTLPLGSQVRVTDVKTGKSVVVRINDRGPHTKGRMIDLSRAAARELGMLRRGNAHVRLEVVNNAERIGS